MRDKVGIDESKLCGQIFRKVASGECGMQELTVSCQVGAGQVSVSSRLHGFVLKSGCRTTTADGKAAVFLGWFSLG